MFVKKSVSPDRSLNNTSYSIVKILEMFKSLDLGSFYRKRNKLQTPQKIELDLWVLSKIQTEKLYNLNIQQVKNKENINLKWDRGKKGFQFNDPKD